MDKLSDILLYICALPILFFLLCTFTNLYSLIKVKVFKKDYFNEPVDYARKMYSSHPVVFTFICLLCIVFVFISSSSILRSVGIYNLKTLPEGYFCFFVELKNNSKSYNVPAKIYIEHEEQDERNDKTSISTNYYLQNVYWSNGGYSTFCDEEIYINKSTLVSDSHNRDYHCTLLNEHAKTNHFTETPIKPTDYIVPIISLFSVFYCWIYCIIKSKRYEFS